MNWRMASVAAAFVFASALASAQTPSGPVPPASTPRSPEPSTASPAGSTANDVIVFGCLKRKGINDWVLANATEALPIAQSKESREALLASKVEEAEKTPVGSSDMELPMGRFEYDLVSASIFGPDTVTDRTVQITGVLIRVLPNSRITVSSLIQVAPRCPFVR